MAAADAPYEHLPMELRLPYCIITEGIAPSLYYIHWKFSPTSGSSSSARIRNYSHTTYITPTMATVAIALATSQHSPDHEITPAESYSHYNVRILVK